MTPSDTPLSTTPSVSEQPGLQELIDSQRVLRLCLQATLVLMLVLSASLYIFFRWELTIARRQIDELTKVVADYEKNTFPVVENFRAKLQAFAQTHPDFVPIYAKYFGATNAPPLGAVTGGAAPAPAAGPARLPPIPGR